MREVASHTKKENAHSRVRVGVRAGSNGSGAGPNPPVDGDYQLIRLPICIVRAEPGSPTWYSESSSPPMPVLAAQPTVLNRLKISRLNSYVSFAFNRVTLRTLRSNVLSIGPVTISDRTPQSP